MYKYRNILDEFVADFEIFQIVDSKVVARTVSTTALEQGPRSSSSSGMINPSKLLQEIICLQEIVGFPSG